MDVTLQVVGPKVFIFGRMIGHDVLVIISHYFDSTIFVGVMRLRTFSCVFNIVKHVNATPQRPSLVR